MLSLLGTLRLAVGKTCQSRSYSSTRSADTATCGDDDACLHAMNPTWLKYSMCRRTELGCELVLDSLPFQLGKLT